MKVRVKEGNRWGQHGPGSVLDVDDGDVQQHPHCFEPEEAHQQRLVASQVTRKRLSVDMQRTLGLTPTGAVEGDVYEIVRLDQGVKERAELAQLLEAAATEAAGPLIGARAERLEALIKDVAARMDHSPGEDPEALDFVQENIGKLFDRLREAGREIQRLHGTSISRDAHEAELKRRDDEVGKLKQALQVAHQDVERERAAATKLAAEVAAMKTAAAAAPPPAGEKPEKKKGGEG